MARARGPAARDHRRAAHCIGELVGRRRTRLTWYRVDAATRAGSARSGACSAAVGARVERLVRRALRHAAAARACARRRARADRRGAAPARTSLSGARRRREARAQPAAWWSASTGPASGKSTVGAARRRAASATASATRASCIGPDLAGGGARRGPGRRASARGAGPRARPARRRRRPLRPTIVGGTDVTAEPAHGGGRRDGQPGLAPPAVRAALLPFQRGLAAGGGIIMAGRDIGSVVLPDAD